MTRNIIKILDKDFSDVKAGQRMLISSPESICTYITKIPKGQFRTSKEMRLDLAKEAGADNTCPVSTGIFLRKAIEAHKDEIPYWRLIDEHHPVVKKLNLDPQEIEYMRNLEEQIKLRGNNILTRRAFALLAYNPHTPQNIHPAYIYWQLGEKWSPA